MGLKVRSTHKESNEPLYIEESEGFSLLRKVYTFENLKTQKGFFLCS